MSLLAFGFKKKNSPDKIPCSDSDKENKKGIKLKNKRKNKTIDKTKITPVKKSRKSLDASSDKIKSTIKIENKTGKNGDKSMKNDVQRSRPNVLSFGEHVHNSLLFLKKENLKDKRQRTPDSPLYDESSLWISPSQLKDMKLTPAIKIWWNFKQVHYDTVLFFKVGKFYELYHMDADVGVQHLNLLHMRGNMSHCGFPEISYGKFATKLVSLGFKVARIEQTETPQQMRERTGKSSGCVSRALCRILTPGTRTLSVRDNFRGTDAYKVDGKTKLLTLHQQSDNKFSFVLCDPTIAKFYFDTFEEDTNFGTLKTLLLTEAPAEIVCVKNNLSDRVLELIKKMLTFNKGKPDTSVFTFISKAELNYSLDSCDEPSLKQIIQESHTCEVATACLQYLKRCLVYKELISYGDFNLYFARKVINNQNKIDVEVVDFDEPDAPKMILDSLALANLDIIQTALGSNSREFTLFHFLNHCCTHFGARNLRKWVTCPLYDIEAIERRLAVVKVFNDLHVELRPIRKSFHKVSDIERMLSKAYALGKADDVAILYEAAKFEQRKIKLLDSLLGAVNLMVDVLKGLEHTVKDNKAIANSVGGVLLIQLLAQCSLEQLTLEIQEFSLQIDEVKRYLELNNEIKPPEILEVVQKIESELERESTGFDGKIKFWSGGSGSERFQIEVANKFLPKNKSAPAHWELKTTKKGFRRFHTKAIKDLVERLCQLEDVVASQGRQKLTVAFSQLDVLKFSLMKVILAGRQIDCLWALSIASLDGVWCKPSFISNSDEPRLSLKEVRHPVVARIVEMKGSQFVPNDLELSSVILLTGPNMGGKSTLLRQTCISVVLAQIGSFVPASSCRMTLFDRVFTRAGAKDCVLQGQSTFAVELFETAVALEHATNKSLVAMDELGRGTSTFDGSAIAYAVLLELAAKGCAAVFSTHYFDVVTAVKNNARIIPRQMKCLEITDENASNDVTFLYKLVEGSSENSFGVNIGKIAGLPLVVIEKAKQKSEEFQLRSQVFRAMGEKDIKKIEELSNKAQG